MLRHESPCTQSIIWTCAPIKPPALQSRAHRFPQSCLWNAASDEQKRSEISSALCNLQAFSIKMIVLGLVNYSLTTFHCSSLWPVAQIMTAENHQEPPGDGDVGELSTDNYPIVDSCLSWKEGVFEADVTQENQTEPECWSIQRDMSTKIYQ